MSIVSIKDLSKVSVIKVYLRQNQNNRAHSVTACIGLWHHGEMHAVHASISLWGACIGLWRHGGMHAVHACISLWHGGAMHALTAWDLKFQVCLRYTFTPATFGLVWMSSLQQLSMLLCRKSRIILVAKWSSLCRDCYIIQEPVINLISLILAKAHFVFEKFKKCILKWKLFSNFC